MGCAYEQKRLAGTDCVGCTCDRKQFCLYNCFLALLYVFLYLSAHRSHTTSFCRTCVPGGHIPDGFWVVWEGPPYRPHSLGDGSKCRRGKGLKTVCLGARCTSAYQATIPRNSFGNGASSKEIEICGFEFKNTG